MMNYTEFKNELTAFVKEVFEKNGIEVLEKETLKNNITLDGLTIDRGEKIASAIVYINGAYEDYTNGTGFYEVCDKVIETLREEKPVEELVGILTDLSTDKLELGIMQLKGNEELLDNLVCYGIEDTGLFVYLIYRVRENGIVKVTKDLAKYFFESEKDLMNIAMMNMKKHLRTQSMMSAMFMLEDDSLDAEGLNVIKADNCYMQGASFIADYETLDKVYDVLGDFVILPSSIYEFLALKIDGNISFEDLKNMVKTVNDTEVAPDEILSYDIYTYINRRLDRKEVA